MDARQADLLKHIDAADLGNRIRAARLALGLTQGDLADGEVSIGYVSRIESGQRRPNGKVLQQLAARLGTTLEQLLGGIAPREYDEIRLTLDYAELALESGEPPEALTHAAAGLERAQASALTELADRGRYLYARALEAEGQLDDAIIELETVATEATSGLLRIKAGIAISRACREVGDFAHAVETGERLLAQLDGTPLAETDESVQLAVTIAASYFERGDVSQAVRVCRKAVTKSERLGSPIARASAYWNASIMELKRGRTEDAVPLAERALALLGEGQDARNLARLRSMLGSMQLRLDDPDIEQAQEQLTRAAQEMAGSSASPADIAQNELALARTYFMQGDPAGAQDICVDVYDELCVQAPSVAAEAKALEGQAHVALGSPDDALAAYQEAVRLLTGVGSDREAAQLWFELAGLLEDLGAYDAARTAYRSAAASTGLRSSALPTGVGAKAPVR
jgi:tetratricopeptide (TPR) repeat protein